MSNFKLTRDRLLGIIAIILGITVTIAGSQLEAMIALDEPGPSLFPMISGVGMAVCGLVMLLRKPKSDEPEKPFASKEGWIRMAILFAILVIYVFVGLEYVGYLISTPLLLMVLYYVLADKENKPKIWFCVLLGLVIGVGLYAFFTSMKISLPKGILLKQFGIKW